jgi:hypothetical protein
VYSELMSLRIECLEINLLLSHSVELLGDIVLGSDQAEIFCLIIVSYMQACGGVY